MYLHVTACIHGYSQNCWHFWSERGRLSNCCQDVWFSRRLGEGRKVNIIWNEGQHQEEFFLSTQVTLVLYRSIVVLNLRLKGVKKIFLTEHPALLNVFRAKWFIQDRLQCLTFLISILTPGWWSSACGPCVSACGLYHCWHELLWSGSVLPSTVQTCRADAGMETMGFPLGVKV